MKKSIITLLLFALYLQSCSNAAAEPTALDSSCDQMAIINHGRFTNAAQLNFTIASVQITGDCLEVEIQASGCNGNTWKVDLLDSGNVAESNPEQRYLKISMNNTELCNAAISKTFTFDLSPLQINSPSILLNLALWDEQIRYEYNPAP